MTALSSADGTQAWYNAAIGPDITSPILFNNLLYVGSDSHFYKVSPGTGGVLADRTLEGGLADRAPAAWGSLVFFVTGTDSGYTLHAVSSETLKDSWTKPLSAASSVLTDGTNLYVLGNTLAALDPATGNERWAVSPPDGYDYLNEGALADGYLVAFAAKQSDVGNVLAAWNIGNGSATPSGVAWTQDFGNDMTDGSPPVIDGGRAFANSRAGILRAFALSTGVPLWNYPVRGSALAPALPVAVDGKVYVQIFISSPAMLCLDGAAGTLVWETPRSMSTSWSQPAIGNGRIYLATDWSGVYAFNTGSLTHSWPMHKNNPAQTSASTTFAPVSVIPATSLLLLE